MRRWYAMLYDTNGMGPTYVAPVFRQRKTGVDATTSVEVA